MASEQDQARSIAERVARRVSGGGTGPSNEGSARDSSRSGAPVRDELSAIRTGLHDLERKLERIESKIVEGAPAVNSETSRARLIDFVSSTPPPATTPSIASAPPTASNVSRQFVPATQSPWLRDFNTAADHPSQERFGVEEATVAELVEFFENEKKCSVEPGGKPCDHCSMCNSRGF